MNYAKEGLEVDVKLLHGLNTGDLRLSHAGEIGGALLTYASDPAEG